tara:strand:- start:5363 stop:5626 length:264 start_codon:yes stop_codon:yes gene_type:complete
MKRVNEIIGQLTNKEYDAVLFGLMVRFLEKKSKQTGYNIDEFDVGISNGKFIISVSDMSDSVFYEEIELNKQTDFKTLQQTLNIKTK